MVGSTTCFIAATDSDSGKSFVTSLLLTQLQQRHADVVALKPVACGLDDDGINPDVRLLQALQPQHKGINLHTTPKPMAPLFDQPITRDVLLPWCQQQMSQHQITLIEGVGGVMVPLADGFTQLDWMMAMAEVKVVLVVRARLGSLSQILTHLTLLATMVAGDTCLIINAIDDADALYAQQCIAVAQQWFPQIDAEILLPNANAIPVCIDRWL
ncbi:MAG: ATP-dependent dethiobiotin synthetase BioD [Mariprofundales bacterium]